MQADSSLLYSSPNWWENLPNIHHIDDNQNKINMEPFPDVGVLAALAGLAYSDHPENENLPKGWILLTTARNNSVSNGYFGCVFCCPSQQQVVVAHRGTASLGSYGIDFKGIYLNRYTKHMGSAVTLADDVKEAILKINGQPGIRLSLSIVGHSLGGWLAGVTTMTVKHLKREGNSFIARPDEGIHAHTIALDNPGVEDMLVKICRDYGVRYDHSMPTIFLDITTYFAKPNIVNCVGYHLGDLHKIITEPEALRSDSRERWYKINSHYIKNFHPDNITKKTDKVQNWPHGLGELKNYHKRDMSTNHNTLNLSAENVPSGISSSHHNNQLSEGNTDIPTPNVGNFRDIQRVINFKLINVPSISGEHRHKMSTHDTNNLHKKLDDVKKSYKAQHWPHGSEELEIYPKQDMSSNPDILNLNAENLHSGSSSGSHRKTQTVEANTGTTYYAAPNVVNFSGLQVGNLQVINTESVTLPSDSGEHRFKISTHDIRKLHKYLDEINKRPKVVQNGNSKENLHYSTSPWSGESCKLGVFSTDEFIFIQNWKTFQNIPLIKRTKINDFTNNHNLEKLELPIFEIDIIKNTITCNSKENLGKIIRETKQLVRWWKPEIMKALDEQNTSIMAAPLYDASQAYVRTLPEILDCEDTFELKSFLESAKRVLQIIVTSDFEFEAARFRNILMSLNIKDYTHPNCHTMLNWNDMHNIAIDFTGLNDVTNKNVCNVTNNNLCILNFPPLTDSNQPQITPDCDLMRTILQNLTLFNHKKLVIIRSQSFGEQFYDEFKITVETKPLKTFELEDLTPLSREKIFSRNAITIGEETLSLEVILGNDCKTPNEKISKLISPILKNLVMDNLYIKIPNNLPRLCELDVLHSKGNKVVSKEGLTALLERSKADGSLLVIGNSEQLNQDYWGELTEEARMRIFTTEEDGEDLFEEKCGEESARLIYWFNLSTEGFNLKEIYNRSVYLPRKFHSRFIIESISKFVQYKGGKDLFIFNNVKDKTSLIQIFGLSGEAKDLLIKNGHFIIRSPSQELSEEDKKKEESFSKHYFEMDIRSNPCLVWKYSNGSLDGLRPFITRDYGDTIDERDFCVMKKKHTIIADDPGMGKTTILTPMSELIPKSWVLRIDHKLFAESSKKLPIRLTLQSVTDYLIYLSGLPTDKKLLSSLLQHCLESVNSRQVCVLVDAFDEFSEVDKVKMAELLKYLKNATTCQTVVTTRVYQQKWLENDSEEFAVELEKITEEEQEDYLVNFWLPHLALELPEHGEPEKARLFHFARELRKEVEGVLGEDVASFMGIPLQIRMLAEVFLQQAILSVSYPEQVNNLGKITNLFDLYKQFIEVKKTIYFEQKTNLNQIPKALLDSMVKGTMEQHCVLAFQTINSTFATEYFTNIKLSDLTTEEVKDISSLGLIKCKADGTFHFIHRTFQEYFCADFFVQWLRQRRNSKEENTLIRNEFCKFLLKPEYKIVRIFIETQLQTMPISGEEMENHPKMYEHCQLNYHDHNKTPLHIAAEEQNARIFEVLLSGPPNRTSDESYISLFTLRNKDTNTVLSIALGFKNTDIVSQITENVRGCPYESILGLMLATFLEEEEEESGYNKSYFEEYFLRTQHLASVNLALKRTRRVKDIFGPFIAAVRRDDYETVLNIFSDLESDTERAYILIATDGWGDTAINLATSKQNHALFKLFAKRGVCVSRDRNKRTPLHCAAIKGHFKIVNFLLNQSEETYEYINIGNKILFDNNNITLKYENNSFLNYQEMLAYINSVNIYGDTALMLAVNEGNHEVTRILLEYGADTNPANSYGSTALILAVQNGNHEVTRMLLESGAEINYQDRKGKTVMFKAAFHGYVNIVELLLQFNADISLLDQNGRTALSRAEERGHQEIVDLLRGHQEARPAEHL